MVNQVLVEESVLGWEELELEVVRDAKGTMITVCFIENVDPMGVHTGDSYCTAPMLTVPVGVQERLQEAAHRIVDRVGVIGGTNVQFGYNPETDRFVVIEINPRTSRSSALASKATVFPIAMVSSLLAAYTPYYAIYPASKAALEHFTRAASKEFGERGINVNAVGPGPMDTPFFYGQESAEAVAYHSSAAALSGFSKKGLTDIEDIAPIIRFLVTEGWWITGQTIFANGGYTTR